MQKRSSSPSAVGLIVAALVVVSGCGDGGTATGPVDPEIVVENSPVRVGTVMTLRARGVTLSAESYEGTLGGETVEFVVQDDSTLVAFVPEIAAGPAEVVLTAGTSMLRAATSVQSGAAIANPVAVVEAALEDAAAAVPATAPAGQSQTEWTASRTAFLNHVEQTRAALQSASAEEQLAAARFVAFFEDEMARVASTSGLAAVRLDNALTCNDALRELLKSSSLALVGLGLAIGGAAAGPWGILIGGVGVALAFEVGQTVPTNYAAATALCWRQESVAITGAFDGGPAMSSVRLLGADPEFTFSRERPFPTTPREEYQKLSPSFYDRFPTMHRVSDIIDDMYDLAQRAPQWIEDLVVPMLPPRPSLAAEQPIETRDLLPAGVRVENVTNGVTLTATADSATLVLTANAPGHDRREFTFDLVSTTDNTVRRTYSAIVQSTGIVLAPISETMQGQWSWDYETDVERMECALQWEGLVVGSDALNIVSFTHINAAPGQQTYAQTDDMGGAIVNGGTEHVLNGAWWRTWPVGVPATSFSVSVYYTWRNTRTGETGTSNTITMQCLRIDG